MSKAPWNHAISTRLALLPTVRPSYAEAAKQVRNRLRRYGADSIVEHAVACLHLGRRMPFLDEMRTWPWITLLIVKLVLEDDTISLTGGQRCSPEAFDRCRQTLFESQGAAERKEDSPGGVHLMMRSLMQAQLPFQRSISWDFLRWPALIARLPADHRCHRHFVERIGIEPETFMHLSYAAYAPVVNGDLELRLRDFLPLRARYGSDLDRFFSEIARDIKSLRSELGQLRSARLAAGGERRPRQELNEFPWLAIYPLLRLADDTLKVWHTAVFARGMEQGVHMRLSERRGGYAQDFSKVFESYVLELLSGSGLPFLSEEEYKRALARSQNTVEAIVTDDGANVFIEAKLTAYSHDVALSHRSPVVWTGLKRVREAMQQAWLVGDRLRGGATPDWPPTKVDEDFLLIVTSQPLACATGEHLRRMFKRDAFDPVRVAALKAKAPTAEHLQRLPLKNIVIASIDEFEDLMDCVRRGLVDLVPFLREVAARNFDPSSSVMFLGQVIGEKTSACELSPLMEAARGRAESALTEILG